MAVAGGDGDFYVAGGVGGPAGEGDRAQIPTGIALGDFDEIAGDEVAALGEFPGGEGGVITASAGDDCLSFRSGHQVSFSSSVF